MESIRALLVGLPKGLQTDAAFTVRLFMSHMFMSHRCRRMCSTRGSRGPDVESSGVVYATL